MVGGVHGRISRITVPKFPDGCRTVLNHISPTRISLVRQDLIGHIYPSVLGQPAHQMLDSQDSGTYMSVKILLRLFHNITENFPFISFRHKSETQ